MATGHSEAQVEEIVSSIFPRNLGSVDLMRPETSQVLQSILEEAQSGNETVRLLAVRRFKDIFRPFQETASAQSAVHAAVFLLERGFMRAINQGLEDSLAGRWLLVPSAEDIEKLAATADGSVPALMKPSICANAVECLAVDSRTVKYMLKFSPRLPFLLKSLFSKEFTLPLDQASKPWTAQIKQAVICAIPRLFPSYAFRMEIGQSTDFLMAVMHSAVAYFQDKIVVRHAASIIHTARLYCFVSSSETVTPLEESFLRFAAKLFTESSDKTWILYILETLSSFIASRLHSLAKGQKPLPEIPALRSSVLALLLCEDELHNSVDAMGLADFAGYLNHSAALAAKGIEAFPGSYYSISKVKQSAREDQAAVQRASQLKGILSSPSESEGSSHIYMSRSRDRDAAVEEALHKGLTGVRDIRAARKCSGPGCEKFEDKPGEFRRCGACKLAVYCGPGCQKAAWKAGHKQVCKFGG